MISLSKQIAWIAAALIAASIVGCNVGPKYQRPVVTIPDDYRGAPANVAAAPGSSFGEQKWFDVFQDPQLQALIRAAVQDNYDVRIAATRILEAQAEVGIVKSDELPSAAGLATINNNRNARSKFLNSYETSNTQL